MSEDATPHTIERFGKTTRLFHWSVVLPFLALAGMIRGRVPLAWAARHHGVWVREVGPPETEVPRWPVEIAPEPRPAPIPLSSLADERP